MNYKSKIYDILNEEREDMIHHLPQPTMLHRRPMTETPSLKGGIRVMKHPLPGHFLPKDPATLATGSDIGSMRPSDQKLAMRRYVRANDLEEDDMVGGSSHLEGGRGINWKKVGRSIKKGLSTVGHYAAPIIKEVGKELLPIVKEQGLKALKTVAENPELLMAAGRSKKNHRVIRGGYDSDSDDERDRIHIDVNSHKGGARKPNARAQIVKRVMNEKGLSLIEASKYVKAHGLYKKK